MSYRPTRRQFLRTAAATGALIGVGDLSFLSGLPRVCARETDLKRVQFDPGLEPLVRFLEQTPREKLLEEVASRIRKGLSYREIVAALLLAGIRNIQPRPVGFKFHAVLVVNSAHIASLSSPESDRWLPIFWALDYFKVAQAQDVREDDWTMAPVEESKVPPAHKARQNFVEAMNNWDEAAADVAVAGLARSAGAGELLEIFSRLGARDYRQIGHKAIYVANSFRTLQMIGWQHAEPVLRSLAYALLNHEGSNPAERDAEQDRPWRRNQSLAGKIRADWNNGAPDNVHLQHFTTHHEQRREDEARRQRRGHPPGQDSQKSRIQTKKQRVDEAGAVQGVKPKQAEKRKERRVTWRKMRNRLVGCQPCFTIALAGQHTARTGNIGNGIVREAKTFRRRLEDEQYPYNGEQEQA